CVWRALKRKIDTFLGTQPRIKSAGCAARCARSLLHPFLAGLVVFAERLNPIPSRTRPLNFPAPMVLSLKAWKSRSLPGLPRTDFPRHDVIEFKLTARNGGHFLWLQADACGGQCFREFRADHNAAIRRRNAFGFSANNRPASRAADLRCASRRALINGVRRDRHGASGLCGAVSSARTARSWHEPS